MDRAAPAMSRAGRVIQLTLLLWILSAAPAAAGGFTGSYLGQYSDLSGTRDCRTAMPMAGMEPQGGGHPVFVYLVGSGESYDGTTAQTIVQAAAARGFVAASVAYSDWEYYTAGIDGNSRCVFDASLSSSAITALCSRAAADCHYGVVVAGFSQGGVIAMRAANWNRRVRAAYLLSVNEDATGPEGALRWQMATTPPRGTRALPDAAIRIVDGIADAPEDRRDELDAQTGKQCPPTALSCLDADGSGWYVVQNSEVANGMADHCYFMGAVGPASCSPDPPFDPTWLTSTTAAWALGPNLDWLAAHTGFVADPPEPVTPAPVATAVGVPQPPRDRPTSNPIRSVRLEKVRSRLKAAKEIRASVTFASAGRIRCSLSEKIGRKTLRVRSTTRTLRAPGTLNFDLKPRKKVADAMRASAGTLILRISFRDEAGRSYARTRRVKLR